MHMRLLILASSSQTRAQMLQNAGLSVEGHAPAIDEEALREGLLAEGASPRDLADALAEHKALRIARRYPQDMVLGCDQILEFDGAVLGKPDSISAARERLARMRGQAHVLWTAAVLYDGGQPVWRHVDQSRLYMRNYSEAFLDDYVREGGWAVTGTTGGYAIEGPGIRLFDRIEGDHFAILGLPLLPLLATLVRRGDIPG
jgi:septum formation protein